MAILGFLTQTLAEQTVDVEKKMSTLPGITTYGIHSEVYVVAVAEAASGEMDALLTQVRMIDGVITLYVTSYTTADEEDTGE